MQIAGEIPESTSNAITEFEQLRKNPMPAKRKLQRYKSERKLQNYVPTDLHKLLLRPTLRGGPFVISLVNVGR